jgi:energy-coupling factor transport system ATP-binding protein
VAFGLENLGVPADEMPARVQKALDAVGLTERARWRIDRLSGGQQQRVALAAALAMQPSALVLDEPSAHLDPRSATALYATIDAVADATGATLVTIEHDLDHVVPRTVRRGLLLDRQGHLAIDAPLAEALTSPTQAQRWAAEGVRLPTPTALALALDPSAPLPLSVEDGVTWLRERPWARQAVCAASRQARSLGDVVIDARGITQRYVSPASSFSALHDVSVSVRQGELVALVGANGSGKSTLLRVLTGLLRLERGEVAIGGVSLRTATPRQIAGLVAHVFQNPEAGFVADTVADELAYGPRALGWSAEEIASHTQTFLERFGLSALERANPFSLSEGQKRRLSVATSLVQGPRALLLDEPTFGQDRQSAEALMDEIAALCARGLAVIVATHDLGLVTDVADRVVALVDGRVVFDGPPTHLLADPDLLEQVGQEMPPLNRMLNATLAGV